MTSAEMLMQGKLNLPRAMNRIWVKRHTHIERATLTMVTVVGEGQGIAQGGLPELDVTEVLALVADN